MKNDFRLINGLNFTGEILLDENYTTHLNRIHKTNEIGGYANMILVNALVAGWMRAVTTYTQINNKSHNTSTDQSTYDMNACVIYFDRKFLFSNLFDDTFSFALSIK